MLVVEAIDRIRREHFVQGKSIKEIARDLRLSRNTVRKVLRSDETSFSYARQVQPRPKLGRWKGELDRLLAVNGEAQLCIVGFPIAKFGTCFGARGRALV